MTAPASPTTTPGRAARVGSGVLLGLAGLMLAVVVIAPMALSSNDLMKWARASLGLAGQWPWFVPVTLDAAAGVCVLLSFWRAMRGKSAGALGVGVWVFAGFSALANYRHGLTIIGSAADAWWFFPATSALGPALLEVVTWFFRNEVQEDTGARAKARPKFGIIRWLPVVGAFRDTYGAYRTAQILGISKAAEAVSTFHQLCPSGKLRVVKAIRARDVAAAQQAAEESARAAKAAADEAARLARAAARSGQAAPDLAVNGHQTNGRAPDLRAVAATGPHRTTVQSLVSGSHQTDQTGQSAADQTSDRTSRQTFGPQAIKDAADIRTRWAVGLPDLNAHKTVKEATGWGQQKVTNALAAYRAGADLSGSAEPPNGDQIGSGATSGSAEATNVIMD